MDLENSSNTVNIMTNNFTKYISDLKQNTIFMQDMINSGHKLQNSLKQTSVHQAQFLECFRRVTDHSRNLYIGTGESKNNVSTSLSHLITYQKSLHQKSNNINSMLLDCVLQPLGTKSIDEWKKNNLHLEKENVKEFKKLSSEIKKMQVETLKLQKKVHKKTENTHSTNNSEAAALQVALQEVSQRVAKLERSSRNAMNACYREQAGRFLTLITAFSPILETQISTENEINNIKRISNDLASYKEQLTGLVSGSQHVPQTDTDKSQTNATQQVPKPNKLSQMTCSSPQLANKNLSISNLSNHSSNLRNRNTSISSASQSSTSNSTHQLSHHHIPSTYGHASAYNLEITGQQNGSKIPSISSRDSGFLSQITHLSVNEMNMNGQVVGHGHSSISNDEGCGSGSSGSKNDELEKKEEDQPNGGALPPPPTDWMGEDEDLPVPPPPLAPKQQNNIFPASLTNLSSQNNLKMAPPSPLRAPMRPPVVPLKPRVNSGGSSVRSSLSIQPPQKPYPTSGAPISPPIPTIPNNRLIHKSLPPTPNHKLTMSQTNIQMRQKIGNNKSSSVSSASMVMGSNVLNQNSKVISQMQSNMENGTATIRRRASARIPANMNFF